jgi:hypothetical protein
LTLLRGRVFPGGDASDPEGTGLAAFAAAADEAALGRTFDIEVTPVRYQSPRHRLAYLTWFSELNNILHDKVRETTETLSNK